MNARSREHRKSALPTVAHCLSVSVFGFKFKPYSIASTPSTPHPTPYVRDTRHSGDFQHRALSELEPMVAKTFSFMCSFNVMITWGRNSRVADAESFTPVWHLLIFVFNKETAASSTELWASNYVRLECNGIVVFKLVFIFLWWLFFPLFQVILIFHL